MRDIPTKFFSTFCIVMLIVTIFYPVAFAQDIGPDASEPVSLDSSPVLLIRGAIAQIDQCGSSADALAFVIARSALNNSTKDFWDDEHAKWGLCYVDHLIAVRAIQSTRAYQNDSAADHEAAITAVNLTVNCDRKLANQSISYAGEARQPVTDRLSLYLMNQSISEAQRCYARAEESLSKGNYTSAVTNYGLAWTAANLAISIANGKTTPRVAITAPAADAYISTPTVMVSGKVDDVAVYSITTVSIGVNGKKTNTPLVAGQFSQQVQLAEGNNTIQATASDLLLNKGTATIKVILDTVIPAITIDGVSDGRYYNAPVLPLVNVTDAHLQGSTVMLDGNLYDGLPVSSEGSHTLSVQATDLAGNVASASVSFVVDRTAPLVAFDVQPSSYLGGRSSIGGSVYDANPGNVSLVIDGMEVASALPYAWDTTGYADGIHNLTLYATDLAGNTGTVTVQAIVDNMPPAVDFLSPRNGSVYRGAIGFEWSGSDNSGISRYELVLGQQRYEATGTSMTLDSIPDGRYDVIVTAYDYANNTGNDSVNVTVDTMAPVIEVGGVVDGGQYNYDLRPVINVTDANLNFSVSALNGIPYDNEPIVAENNYSLSVYAEDLAGNSASRMVNFTVDKTPPALLANELTRNPNVLNLTYYVNGTIEPDALLTINNEQVLHNETFEHPVNMSVGVNIVNITATDAAGNNAPWNVTRLIDEDLLPDYYEAGTLGMDPLCNDSDSTLTSQNEAGNGIPDDMEDLDGDGLINCMELMIGTDPLKADTDGDGLPDMYEFQQTRTSPILADTDGNNASDAMEDPDYDGLTNLQECNAGTNPLAADTDGDTLNDSYEREIGSNPLLQDSDGDGLPDNVEVKLGTNPGNPDSDGNGVPDNLEKFTTVASDSTLGISVSITGTGDLSKELAFTNETSPYFTSNPALISPLVNISSNDTFDSAVITIHYDPGRVNNTSSLRLGYYNETLGLFITVPSSVDTANHTVSASVSHFSVWGAFDDIALTATYQKVSDFNSATLTGIKTNDGQDVYLQGHAQSWPNDIRFAGQDGSALNYWIESYDDNNATVWVKVPQISAYPGTTTVSVYYSKVGDSGASNGFDTFAAFEDFSNDARRTTTWIDSASGAYSGMFTDVHGFENNGYHVRQYNYRSSWTEDRIASISLRVPLGTPTWCNVTLVDVSESGRRNPPWISTGVGYGSSLAEWGYWQDWSGNNVFPYDTKPGHTYVMSWTDGRIVNNTQLFEDGRLVNIRSASFSSRQPSMRVHLGHDAIGEWYFKNFYARSYTANEPAHGGWSTEVTAASLPFSGYAYVKTHDITGSTDGSLSSYQVKFIVHRGIGPADTGNVVDSDGDGLPDVVEESGFMDSQGHFYQTDPYDEDTDGDGLSDGVEAGTQLSNEYCKYYYNVKSDPTNGDTDGDGLGDGEEVDGHDIRVANTHDSALGFKNAFFGLGASGYLTTIPVKSDPKKQDSDFDGVDDYTESLWGTNPSNKDTDGDSILDNVEKGAGEDPTIFDITPPTAMRGTMNWYKPALSFKEIYDVTYMLSDPSGLKSASLIKDGLVRATHTYEPGITAVGQYDHVETDWEMILDALRSSEFDVAVADQHGNSATYEIWRQYAIYSQLAALMGADTIGGQDAAMLLGMLSGISIGLAQWPDLALDFYRDPLPMLQGFLEISMLMAVPGGQLAAGALMGVAVVGMEEAENPYPLGTEPGLHVSFAGGWGIGYAVTTFACGELMAEGAAAGITTSARFIGAIKTEGLTYTLLRRGPIMDELRANGFKADMITYLSREIDLANLEIYNVEIAKEPTVVRNWEATMMMERLSQSALENTILRELANENMMNRLLSEGITPEEATRCINAFDESTLNQYITLSQQKNVPLYKLLRVTENTNNRVYSSSEWLPGVVKDPVKNYYSHYTNHAKDWGVDSSGNPIISQREYGENAAALLNELDGVERYYNKGDNTLTVYRPLNELGQGNEWVQGTVDGKMKTYFRPREGYEYVLRQIRSGQLIRIN